MTTSKKEKEREKRLYKTYGISLTDWYSMSQNGCQICGRTFGRLCIDHIHVKGFKKMTPLQKRTYVRGALCFICNTTIGKLERTANGPENRKRLHGINRYFSIFSIKGEL